MGLNETWVEGSPKKVLRASGVQISGYKKKYLRSLSPSIIKTVVKLSVETSGIQDLIGKFFEKRVCKSRENRRFSMMQTTQVVPKTKIFMGQKKRAKKIVFKECLRLNNL